MHEREHEAAAVLWWSLGSLAACTVAGVLWELWHIISGAPLDNIVIGVEGLIL